MFRESQPKSTFLFKPLTLRSFLTSYPVSKVLDVVSVVVFYFREVQNCLQSIKSVTGFWFWYKRISNTQKESYSVRNLKDWTKVTIQINEEKKTITVFLTRHFFLPWLLPLQTNRLFNLKRLYFVCVCVTVWLPMVTVWLQWCRPIIWGPFPESRWVPKFRVRLVGFVGRIKLEVCRFDTVIVLNDS